MAGSRTRKFFLHAWRPNGRGLLCRYAIAMFIETYALYFLLYSFTLLYIVAITHPTSTTEGNSEPTGMHRHGCCGFICTTLIVSASTIGKKPFNLLYKNASLKRAL